MQFSLGKRVLAQTRTQDQQRLNYGGFVFFFKSNPRGLLKQHSISHGDFFVSAGTTIVIALSATLLLNTKV